MQTLNWYVAPQRKKERKKEYPISYGLEQQTVSFIYLDKKALFYIAYVTILREKHTHMHALL